MSLLSWWRKRRPGPSDEAVRAHGEAQATADWATEVYRERRRIMDENHFAQRIRHIYEGRA